MFRKSKDLKHKAQIVDFLPFIHVSLPSTLTFVKNIKIETSK